MTVAMAVAFNLIVNAIGSFAIAALLAALAARALRAPPGRWRQFFLVLPLAKVAADLAYGVPPRSFFWNKLAGQRQDLGQFQFGVGIDHFVVPKFQFGLGALRAGVTYPQSVAELCATGLTRKIGPWAPEVVAAAVVLVGACLLARRITGATRSLRAASRVRRGATVVERQRAGGRAVDVVVAEDPGVPFAAGVLRPFVCLPRRVHEALDPAERAAVVRHELGHLAHHDLLLFAVLGAFADLLWFVPGLGMHCRAAREHAEIAADRWAIANGARAADLASALVRVAEIARPLAGRPLGLFRAEALLVRRVRGLLDAPATSPERARRAVWARLAAAAWVAAIVFSATSCGNR